MSLEYEEQMIDKISVGSDSFKSDEQKALEDLLLKKNELMNSQQRNFISDLFKANSNLPINIARIEANNTENIRASFLEKQFEPILHRNIYTLAELFKNIDIISANLIKSNICEGVSVNLVPQPPSIFNKFGSKSSLIPIFNITPVKRFYAKTGTNIGNGEGDGYIQLQWKNIFGGSETLTLDAIAGTKTSSSYLLKYSQPIINNANIMYESIGHLNSNKLDWIQSEANTKGFLNRIFTQYNQPLNFELILDNSWRQLKNTHSKSLEVWNQSGDNFKSSISFNMRYDTRDNKHMPTSGLLFKLGLEYSGLMNICSSKCFKTVLEISKAFNLNDYHSLIISNSAGVLFPLGSTSHILDRFYIGGPNDVRSFLNNGIGPKDFGSSIGGDIFMKYGVSLISRIPYVSRDSNFRIHNFVNAGKLIPLDKDHDIKTSIKDVLAGPSVGFGFGILYNHPAARFELNFVLPLAQNRFDSSRKGLQYGIGISFL